MKPVLGAAILLAIGFPQVPRAQIVTVIVRDSATTEPLGDVLVSLLDTTAALVAAQRTSRRGQTTFRVPGPSHYALRVQHLGWRQLVSAWIPVADRDTLEVTVRPARLTVTLTPVLIAAQQDSISRLVPLGINPRAFAGRIIVPAQIEAHEPGSRDYVELLGAVGIPGLVTHRWVAGHREQHCIASARSLSHKYCAVIYVNNVRTDAQNAIDVASPSNLDFAIWVPPIEAGVLYGGDAAAGVLLLFTKDYRLVR